MCRNMYDISLDLEIKISAEIFYCVRHSTDVTLASIKFPVLLEIQHAAYTHILPYNGDSTSEIIAFCQKNFIQLSTCDQVACL